MEKEINPLLKSALELGPTLLFFVAYLRIKDDVFVMGGTEYSGFIVAALGFIPLLLVSMGVLWWLTGKLSRMQIVTAVMVIVFGGLTAWFNDERFFKMKTTLVYGLLAGILGIGLLQGRSYLAYVMGEMMPLKDEGWMILTRRLALAFTALAIGNEIVWRSFSTELWVKIETFGFPIALMVFLWVQIMALQTYIIEEDEAAK
jgi:intracellular septation protein